MKWESAGSKQQALVLHYQTVNRKFYINVLEHLRQRVHRMRHNCSTTCDSCSVITRPLTHSSPSMGSCGRKSFVVYDHAAYLRDLARCEFFLFLTATNGSLRSTEVIQKVTIVVLNSLQENSFRKCCMPTKSPSHAERAFRAREKSGKLRSSSTPHKSRYPKHTTPPPSHLNLKF
jgi:hypothetical protein